MGCHAVFQAATPQPLIALHRRSRLPPSNLSLSQNPNRHPLPRRRHRPLLPPAGFVGPPKHRLAVRAAAAPAPAPAPEAMPGDVEPGQWDALERCFAASPDSDPPSCSSSSSSLLVSGVMAPVMKGQYGAFGAVTLEKSKLDLSQKTTQSSAETATGGGGGDIGKKNFHGGGDGGDDGGDDDDYFDDFDEDDEGDEGGLFRRRLVLQELFDRKFVDAVLQEWYKTMINLPAGLRQAYEMGLVSSAQMVRFLSINARPTTSRFISRALPQSLSRAFIGRMLADPSFLYKLILEQAATIGCAVWWELKNRKERIKQEWDLALINVLTASACNAFIVWSLAPCRSYGNTFRFDLQNTIQKLPNNVFEKSYPLREFDLQKRIQSFFLYKVPELCLVGVIAGSLQGILLKVSSAKKEGRLSVTIPSVSTYALGYGSFLGLYANLRYQLLCGIDRFMFDRFDVLGVPIFFSTALRILNVQIGEISRHAWLGVEADPLLQSDNLLKAYNRPSEATNSPSSKWFISKNTIISGLGLLGIKQGSGEPEAKPSKTRRKRIVRKKARTA